MARISSRVLAGLLVLILTLSACTPQQESSPTEQTKATEETETTTATEESTSESSIELPDDNWR